jgi:hypothetical protein
MCGIQGVENVTSHYRIVLWWPYKLYWSCCWCPETETSSFYLAHLSRLHLKTEIESSLQNVLF